MPSDRGVISHNTGRPSVLLTLYLATSVAGATSTQILRFDTHGGDAWTFAKVISGTITRSACDTVTLLSARGRVSAQVVHDHFVATVPLVAGGNSVQAVCLRGGKRVGAAVRQSWTVRLADRPRAAATLSIQGESVLIDATGSKVAPALPARISRYRWEAADTNPAPLQLQSGPAGVESVSSARGLLLRLRSPKVEGDYRVSLTVTDTAGRSDQTTILFRVGGAGVVAFDPLHDHPDWRACTILYGAAPFLFGRDGLPAITRHLEQIARLGATALWLAPITDAPPGDFGYSLTDPFRLRSSLGSAAQLQALIQQAHARGLRVLLDFVTNHLAKQHPYFVDATRFGQRSPYFDWFERDSHGQPVHYFDWTSLENLNYNDAEVRNYMLAAVTHWFREFQIDGFRADAAWAVRERDPSFWPVMRLEVERIRPDSLLLAEATARDPYYMSHGFDATYDWTGQLGHWAWHGVFGPPGELPNLRILRMALTNGGRGLDDATGVLHFLNNNDTGKRFIATHSLADTRLAAALLFTIPGIPLIYAGDEVGASFEPYAHPAPLDWSDPDHLTALYTRLTKLRREVPALHAATLRLIPTSHEDSVLAYNRAAPNPDQDVTLVLNFGVFGFDFPVRSIHERRTSNVSWWAEDLLTGTRTVAPADAETIRVAPHGALLLRRAVPQRSAQTAGVDSSCHD